MPVLTLDYRHCDRKRPKFIKHVEIEAIAASARQQLVESGVAAIAFDTLRQIERLKINGIDFALEVSTDCEVHDEDGNHVFGICEYDPGVPDTAMVCLSRRRKTQRAAGTQHPGPRIGSCGVRCPWLDHGWKQGTGTV